MNSQAQRCAWEFTSAILETRQPLGPHATETQAHPSGYGGDFSMPLRHLMPARPGRANCATI